MNARTLGTAIAVCALVSATGAGATTPSQDRLGAGGFAVERGRVATLVGTGLTLQPHAAIAPTLGAPMYSDARLKTEIRTLSDALATVQSLRGVTFRWNPAQFKDRTVPTGRQIGFIAQEAQRVLPEVVTTDENGYLSIQYSNVVPVLVEAIKEQQKQIDAKDAAIEKLRSDADEAVRDLQTRLADVEDALNRMATTGGIGYTSQPTWREIAPGVYKQF